LPRGWFLPVVPGTRYVTVGGAIASDIHGKNHHQTGSFSARVESIDLLLSSGERVVCSPSVNTDLFQATCGGMGLTGVILSAKFRLMRVETASILQKTFRAPNLDEIMKLFDHHREAIYSVAWIDCLARGKNLGRSILFTGEHARREHLDGAPMAESPFSFPMKRKWAVPFNLPPGTLNRITVSAFNAMYYRSHRSHPARPVNLIPFFFPLDAIHHWNRIYGRRGFFQYQFVMPPGESYEGIKRVLELSARSGNASFLAVLKLFGKQDSLMSFPMEGYTLAMDFPVTRANLKLAKELDKQVLKHGGRIYLTKDARMPREVFESSYPNRRQFSQILEKWDPERKFASFQSMRLGITS